MIRAEPRPRFWSSGGRSRGEISESQGVARNLDFMRRADCPERFELPRIDGSISRRVLLAGSTGLVAATGLAVHSALAQGSPTPGMPGSQSRILRIDKGRFTVRRVRLAPEMISTPGHRASRRRQRGALSVWSQDAFSAPSAN